MGIIHRLFGKKKSNKSPAEQMGINPQLEKATHPVEKAKVNLPSNKEESPVEKVACTRCGEKILPDTAKRFNGLCARCAKYTGERSLPSTKIDSPADKNVKTDGDVWKPCDVDDFRVLPRWAVVAFTARCGRRIQPLFEKTFKGPTPAQIKLIDDAITLAEQAAATGSNPADDLSGITNGINKSIKISLFNEPIHHGRFPDTSYASMVSVVASSAVELLNNPPEMVHASIAVKNAQMASGYAVKAGDPLPEYIGATINRDFEILVELTKKHGWTDNTPVPPTVFGLLWPNGVPTGWPVSQVVVDKEKYSSHTNDAIGEDNTLGTREDSGTNLASEFGMKQSGDTVFTFISPVAKKSVLAGDISDISQISSQAKEQLNKNGEIQEWNLTISGYDDDPRDLWEIPEVRLWCMKAYSYAPHLPCILSQRSIMWFLPCISEIETGERRKRVLSPSEQLYIDKMVSQVAGEDQQEAQRLRASMEWVTPYRIKPQEKLRFTIEVANGISKFLEGTGLSKGQILQIAEETGKRMGQVLNIGT